MPERLLQLLTTTPQSGDDLGAALGLSRVSVNALARRLREQGVPLHIGRAGYALAAGTPAPGLLPLRGEFGRALRYFGEIGSTQDTLRDWAADPLSPAPHGAAVVAERQTAGRGRRGRTWQT
ncbi:MAG: bifunctional biotin--[acetyl-CoA-carboxylase] synthetase/biotin operon repressor, partial [Deinococcus sp.]|nr:bifunctional biotin--[acetyl-CoA-carboxylase] synthetase/biotin operon repressor [Deinococcus sp.]